MHERRDGNQDPATDSIIREGGPYEGGVLFVKKIFRQLTEKRRDAREE